MDNVEYLLLSLLLLLPHTYYLNIHSPRDIQSFLHETYIHLNINHPVHHNYTVYIQPLRDTI